MIEEFIHKQCFKHKGIRILKILLIVFFLCGCSTQENTVEIEEEPKLTKEEIKEVQRNTALNYSGLVVADDETIYFANRRICKMDKESTKTETIYIFHVSQLNVVGEWIYCVDNHEGKILKIKTDGSQTKKVLFSGKKGKIKWLKVIGDKLYFTMWKGEKKQMMKMNLNGKNLEKVFEDTGIFSINYIGNYVYYYNNIPSEQENKISSIFQYNIETGEKKCLQSDINELENLLVYGENLYYTASELKEDTDIFSRIIKINLETNKVKEVYSGNRSVSELTADENHLYFVSTDEQFYQVICSIDFNGKNEKILLFNETYRIIGNNGSSKYIEAQENDTPYDSICKLAIIDNRLFYASVGMGHAEVQWVDLDKCDKLDVVQ